MTENAKKHSKNESKTVKNVKKQCFLLFFTVFYPQKAYIKPEQRRFLMKKHQKTAKNAKKPSKMLFFDQNMGFARVYIGKSAQKRQKTPFLA